MNRFWVAKFRPMTERARHRGGLCLWLIPVLTLSPLHARGDDDPARAEYSVDDKGRIVGASLGGEIIPFETGVSIFGRGWDPFYTLGSARGIEKRQLQDRTIWSGPIVLEDDQTCRYWGMIHENGREAYQKVILEAESDLAIEGAYFHIRLPVEKFRNGEVTLQAEDGQPPKRIVLPRNQRDDTHILGRGSAQRVTIAPPDSLVRLEASLNSRVQVQLQDNRRWHSPYFVLMFKMSGASMKAGERAGISLTYQGRGKADAGPVELLVQPPAGESMFRGLGGNYCFQINSPQTERTLEDFQSSWARTEISLREWEPRNDNGDPQNKNWGFLRNQDKQGGNLEHEFTLASRIQKRGTKLVASIWDLPEWMYVTQGRKPYARGRQVAENLWPEVIESIISYLMHARVKYGVEPELISFNEPDIGICVSLSPEKYREVAGLLAAALHEADLKTKLLLGDVSNPREGLDYIKAVVGEDDLPDYFGALGMHSWGGGSPEQYNAWRRLARKLGIPLMITELGVDPEAWRTETYHSWYYTLQQIQMYQELLLHAAPQVILEWEFTGDYPLLKAAGKDAKLVPTKRYWVIQHVANLTPVPSLQLETSSSRKDVILTGFTTPGPAEDASFTLHIVNLGAGRKMTLSGLPEHVRFLAGRRTSRTESFTEIPPREVKNGRLVYDLPPQSLVTLQYISPPPQREAPRVRDKVSTNSGRYPFRGRSSYP